MRKTQSCVDSTCWEARQAYTVKNSVTHRLFPVGDQMVRSFRRPKPKAEDMRTNRRDSTSGDLIACIQERLCRLHRPSTHASLSIDEETDRSNHKRSTMTHETRSGGPGRQRKSPCTKRHAIQIRTAIATFGRLLRATAKAFPLTQINSENENKGQIQRPYAVA